MSFYIHISKISAILKEYRFQFWLLLSCIFFKVMSESLAALMMIPVLDNLINADNSSSSSVTVLIELLGVNKDGPTLTLLVLVIVFVIMESIFGFLYYFLNYDITTNFPKRKQCSLLSGILHLDWNTFTSFKAGTLYNSLLNEVNQSRQYLQNLFALLESSVSVLLYLMTALFIASWYLFIPITAVFFITLLMIPIYIKVKRMGLIAVEYNNEISQSLNESIFGGKTIKASSLESTFIERFSNLAEKYRKHSLQMALLKYLPSIILKPIILAVMVIVVWVMREMKAVSVTEVAVLAALMLRVMQKMTGLQSQWMKSSGAVASFDYVEQFEKELHSEKEICASKNVGEFKSLEFCNVNFSYGDKEVLHDISLKIKKGEFIGIVGSSGSGKSTAMDIMLQLQRPQTGKFLINGLDVNELNLQDWREKIGFVPQESIIFHDSIYENISLGKKNNVDIGKYAKMAFADDFISESEDAYQTVVGDRGVKLSGGQRQRISLARAFARNPELLFLDEATSALDSESEFKIQQALAQQHGQVTIVCIAHRLSTVMGADRVYVLKDGRIVEFGAPRILMKKEGHFCNLLKQQGLLS